jgi:uncharacterized membrane protein
MVYITESHKRTIAKAVSYRLVALIATALMIGLSKAVSIHIVLTVLYYICERVWLKISWGLGPSNKKGE